MLTRWTGTSALIALAIAVAIAGCGDSNDNQTIFVEPTATPHGGTTATPTPHPGATATSTVEATATPVVEPTATPASEATPTATEPSPVSTPDTNGCRAGDQIVVTESLDKGFGGVTVDLTYPASVNIPGTGSTSDVSQRVHFAVSGGLPSVNDHPSNGGATDDTLTLSFVSSNDNPPGTFATITFDCVTGQAPPSAGDFACAISGASDSAGTPLSGVHCSLGLTGP